MRFALRLSSWRASLSFALAAALAACSVSDLVSVDPTQPGFGQVGNDVVETYDGAVRLYHGALNTTAQAVAQYALRTGVMTDELQAAAVFNDQGNVLYPFADADARDEPMASLQALFVRLSGVRLATRHAREALQRYPTQVDSVFIGELAGLEGMADLLLAEGFCSGVPLTEFPYGDNFRYSAGYPTDSVLHRALTLFDVALNAGGDSVPIATLARVGRGRAWLALGQYDSAAAAVAVVPLTAMYRFALTVGDTLLQTGAVPIEDATQHQVVNREGGTGPTWIAANAALQDPRVPVTTETLDPDPNVSGDETMQFTSPVRQAKIPVGTSTSFVLASGVEAHLIIAEAQLRASLTSPASTTAPWLVTLNALRTTVGLPDTLSDPGTTRARVALLFRERGFWLYLTGHRQGDLRRLAKQYKPQGYSVATAYPSGAYPLAETLILRYANTATIAVPDTERQYNALYTGCLNRDP